MQDQSTPRKKLSGSQRRHIRVAQGLPRYTDTEAASRRAADLRRPRWPRATHKARIDAIKLGRGCIDCGYNAHPHALDFDHLPGTKKVTTIAYLASSGSWDRVLLEIAKCEVRCANCHRIQTAERRKSPPGAVD